MSLVWRVHEQLVEEGRYTHVSEDGDGGVGYPGVEMLPSDLEGEPSPDGVEGVGEGHGCDPRPGPRQELVRVTPGAKHTAQVL